MKMTEENIDFSESEEIVSDRIAALDALREHVEHGDMDKVVAILDQLIAQEKAAIRRGSNRT